MGWTGLFRWGLPWVPCELGQGPLASSVKGMILPCSGGGAECRSCTVILISAVILTLGPLPTCPTAHFQLSDSHRGLQTSLDQWVKGLSQATQPCGTLLWSAALERDQARQRQLSPLADPRPATVSLRTSVSLR